MDVSMVVGSVVPGLMTGIHTFVLLRGLLVLSAASEMQRKSVPSGTTVPAGTPWPLRMIAVRVALPVRGPHEVHRVVRVGHRAVRVDGQ
jgi:hypothetical protein